MRGCWLALDSQHAVPLPGDHLYRMDYMDFVQKHVDTGVRAAQPLRRASHLRCHLPLPLHQADITVSAIPMDDSRASDFGLMKARAACRCARADRLRPPPSPTQIDATGRIIGFAEKPKGDALKAWAVDTTILGLSPVQARPQRRLLFCVLPANLLSRPRSCRTSRPWESTYSRRRSSSSC